MEKERSSDRLARYIITAAIIAVVAAACWYFRSVLVYIIMAFVVSLLCRPIMKILGKVRIKGKGAPSWLLAILTICLVLGILGFIIVEVIPIISGIIRDAYTFRSQDPGMVAANPLDKINQWIISAFPKLGPDFDATGVLLDRLSSFVSVGNVSSAMSSIIGSVASVVISVVVGLFSVVFISFFFVKDEKLFSNIIGALVPDRLEENVRKAISDIEGLLSRYFVGMLIEIFGVALLDFLGLWLIARLDFHYASGIAFIAGLLNIIPYVGPICGEIIGVVLSVVLKYGTGAGLDVNLWTFAIIVLAIMLFTQLIDNFVYQPLIYSTSIKSSPLEIFIVLLIAGTLGGVVGMLVAIPAYTVVRVIAIRFFHDRKAVRRLIPELEQQTAKQ